MQPLGVKAPAIVPPGIKQSLVDVLACQVEPPRGHRIQNMGPHLPLADARDFLHSLPL